MHAVVDCGPLTNPVDGMVDTAGGTTFGNEATYSCINNYELIGPPTRVCMQDGVWSETEPTCNGKPHLHDSDASNMAIYLRSRHLSNTDSF